MAVALTSRAISTLAQTVKEPNIVVSIDGVDTVYGAQIIQKYVRIGDGSDIGETESDPLAFYIGGTNLVGDQDNSITLDGTTTSIKQSLDPSRGQGSSISTMSIALMDNGDITRLISPGAIIDDLLMRQTLVYYGFNGTAWPDDYSVIFRGFITDIQADAGKVTLALSATDEKKRTNIYKKVETTVVGGLSSTATVVQVASVANFLNRIQGPDGTYDSSFTSCLRVDDEIIKYTEARDSRIFPATITIASPGVFTAPLHELSEGEPFVLNTTGALPTGLVGGATYYAKNVTTNTFQASATEGGVAINTSGTQSGTHNLTLGPRVVGCTRGYLFTGVVSHSDGADAATYYVLSGNGVQLALKLMASGNASDGAAIPFVQDIPFTSINIGGPDYVTNSLFFKDTNVEEKYGLAEGDWLQECGGSQYSANRVRNKQILEIVRGETGDFVVIDGVTFIDDTSVSPDNELTCSFVSQYATLPDGCLFRPDEIDVAEHQRLYRLFLSGVDYTFYIKDGISNAREFIEQEIYMPMAAYSLPRKARASMGYHIGPIPGANIVTFDETNIKNPTRISVKRSTTKNFYNEVVYKYDMDPLDDAFKGGFIAISETSKDRIKYAPNKTLVIESRGLRSNDQAENIANEQSSRRLKRYEFGAESIQFEAMLESGLPVEIGDIIVFDGTNLQVPDSKNAVKGMKPRLLEIQNKDFQTKSGDIKFEAVDTNFNGSGRYALISPASRIKSGVSTTEFLIEESYASRFRSAEYRKWSRLRSPSVRIRNADFSQVADSVIISSSSNRIEVSPALPFTPSAGMILELSHYDDSDVTDQVKLVYAHMKDSDFGDGNPQYQML